MALTLKPLTAADKKRFPVGKKVELQWNAEPHTAKVAGYTKTLIILKVGG